MLKENLTMKTITTLIYISFLFLLLAQNSNAGTPWLGEEGDQTFSSSLVYEEFIDFWKGKQKAKLGSDIQQWTVWLNYNYNLTDELALSITTGYTNTHFALATRGDFNGVTDSKFSVKYLLNDEFADGFLPLTVTAQAAGIVAASYQKASPGNPHSPGDGANGLETSLLIGKMFDFGISIFGDVGYRWRDSSVPNDLFFSAGSSYQFLPDWSASARYIGVIGQSGLDIGVPPFDKNVGFPKLKEVVYIMEYGLNWNISYEHSLGINYARIVDGRNTGQSDAFSATYSFLF